MLDALAQGTSDPAVVEQLKLANRSRHLTLLRAVLDRARILQPSMGPLPPMDEAWTLLAAAQKQDAKAADLLLTHPQTGLWAARVLKRLGEPEAPVGTTPLWAELGYFHLLATAAAIRAKHDFRFRVPAWRGIVMLPTLGLADVQSRREWDLADIHAEGRRVLVRSAAGSVHLPDDRATDGVGWVALRKLAAGESELWFDDISPFRELNGLIPPQRLPAREMALWANYLSETWQLIAEHHPAIAEELVVGLNTLAPRAVVDRNSPFSSSHPDAFGFVVLSLPVHATAFAATLIHEFQHSKLGVLLTVVDFLEPGHGNDIPQLYSPWRTDPRPATGILHGVFSFLGVTAFYRKHHAVVTGPAARAAQFEFAYHHEQSARAAETLLTEANPTALGRRFLSVTKKQLNDWRTDPLPTDIRTAARLANLDHWLSWRMRHLQPPSAMVKKLAQAWLRHRPRPAIRPMSPELAPSNVLQTHARLALTRIRLNEPDLYNVYRAEPELAMTEIAGATQADIALVNGDTETAAALYNREIIERPDSVTSWAGLALARRDKSLIQHPELVFAVYQRIRTRTGASDPGHLARWFS